MKSNFIFLFLINYIFTLIDLIIEVDLFLITD